MRLKRKTISANVKRRTERRHLQMTHLPPTQETAAAWTSAEQSIPGMFRPTHPRTIRCHSWRRRTAQGHNFQPISLATSGHTHLVTLGIQRAGLKSLRAKSFLDDLLYREFDTLSQTGSRSNIGTGVVQALTFRQVGFSSASPINDQSLLTRDAQSRSFTGRRPCKSYASSTARSTSLGAGSRLSAV